MPTSGGVFIAQSYFVRGEQLLAVVRKRSVQADDVEGLLVLRGKEQINVGLAYVRDHDDTALNKSERLLVFAHDLARFTPTADDVPS